MSSISPFSDTDFSSLVLYSINKTPKRRPILSLVAYPICQPPLESRVIFTCGRPFSSKLALASVTFSPVITAFFSSKALLCACSFRKLNRSPILDLDSNLNSKLAVLPMILFASAVSCTPGNSTTILFLPCLDTMGSETPNSFTLFLREVKFCLIALSSMVEIVVSFKTYVKRS